MEPVLNTLGLLATAALFGSMAFFSAVMAPLIFAKLDGETAGRFIRQVFPWYYSVVAGTSALAAVTVAPLSPADGAVLAAIAATTLIARQVLMPRINRARDAVVAGERGHARRFSRLHRASVVLNAVQLLAAAVVLARSPWL